ncbi:hypothetical protein TNCV_2457071 [Trichonephila clavipes]|nr:hypothetical protein TNCV_2457071 [Trichonephila clavipes]
MIEIYKSHGRYYIIVPKVTFPTFVEHYVLPCRVGTLLEFHGFPIDFFTDAPGVLTVQFERTVAGFVYQQNHPFITPHVTEEGIVPFEVMRDSLLPEIISHYPELTLRYYDTLLCVWPYTQTFWTMKRRHPNHWKLDSYLQMKPLRHSPCQDKKVFTSLNDLLGEEDWVRELLKNGSGEPFDEI